MKIRIAIATSNGLDLQIQNVAMQDETFCKDIIKCESLMIIKIIVLLLQSKDDITRYQENTGSKKFVKKSSEKNLRKLYTNKTRTWEEKLTLLNFIGNCISLILSYH